MKALRSSIKNNLNSKRPLKVNDKSNEIYDEDEDGDDGDQKDKDSKLANSNFRKNENYNYAKLANNANCSELVTCDDPNEFLENHSEIKKSAGSNDKIKNRFNFTKMTSRRKVSDKCVNVYDDDNGDFMNINHPNLVMREEFDSCNPQNINNNNNDNKVNLLPYPSNKNNMPSESKIKTMNKKEIEQKVKLQQTQLNILMPSKETFKEKKSNNVKNIGITKGCVENDEVYDEDDNMNTSVYPVGNLNNFQNDQLKDENLIKTKENSSRDLRSPSITKRFKTYTKQLKTQVQQRKAVSKQTLEKSKALKPEKEPCDNTITDKLDEIYDEEYEVQETEEVYDDDENTDNEEIKDDQISERSLHNEIHNIHSKDNVQGQRSSEKNKKLFNFNSMKKILTKEMKSSNVNQNDNEPKIENEEIPNINKELSKNEDNLIFDAEEIYVDDSNVNENDNVHGKTCEEIPTDEIHVSPSKVDLQNSGVLPKKEEKSSSSLDSASPNLKKRFQNLQKKTTSFKSKLKNHVKNIQHQSNVKERYTPSCNDEVYDEDMEKEIHIENKQSMPKTINQEKSLQLFSKLQIKDAKSGKDNLEKVSLKLSPQNLIDTEEIYDDDENIVFLENFENNKKDGHDEVYDDDDDDENENNAHDNTDKMSTTNSQKDIRSINSNENSQNQQLPSKNRKPSFCLDSISPSITKNIQYLQNKTTNFKSKLKKQVKTIQHQPKVTKKCISSSNDEVYDEDMGQDISIENTQSMQATEEIYDDDDDNNVLHENREHYDKPDHEEVYDVDYNQINDDQATNTMSLNDCHSKQSNNELRDPSPIKKRNKSFSSTVHFLEKRTASIKSNITNQVKQMPSLSNIIKERLPKTNDAVKHQCKIDKENALIGNGGVFDGDTEKENQKKKIQNFHECDDIYDDDENVPSISSTEHIAVHSQEEVYEDDDSGNNNNNDSINHISETSSPKDFKNNFLPSKVKKSPFHCNPGPSLLKTTSKCNLNIKDKIKNLTILPKADKSKSPSTNEELYDDDENMDDIAFNNDQSYEVISSQGTYDKDSNDIKSKNSKSFEQASSTSSDDKNNCHNNCQLSSISPLIQTKDAQLKVTLKYQFQNIKSKTKKPILLEKMNKDQENAKSNDDIYDEDEKDESNENNENTKQSIKTTLSYDTKNIFPNSEVHENVSNDNLTTKDSCKKEKKSFNFNFEKKLATFKTNFKDQVTSFRSDSNLKKEFKNDESSNLHEEVYDDDKSNEIEEIKKSEICENEDIYDDDENVNNDNNKEEQKSETISQYDFNDNKLSSDTKSTLGSLTTKKFFDLNPISHLLDKNIFDLEQKTSKIKLMLKGHVKQLKHLSKTKKENSPLVNNEIYDVDDDAERGLCDSGMTSINNVSDLLKNFEDLSQENTDHSSQGSLQTPKLISKKIVKIPSEIIKGKKNIIDRNLKVIKEKTRIMAQNIKTQVQTFKESTRTNKTTEEGNREILENRSKENDDIYDDDENCNDLNESLDLAVISEQDVYDDDNNDIKNEISETPDEDSLASSQMEIESHKTIQNTSMPLITSKRLTFIQKKKDSLKTNIQLQVHNIKRFTKNKKNKRTLEKIKNDNFDRNEEVYDDDENSERLRDKEDNASGFHNNESAEIYDEDETQLEIPRIQKPEYQNRKQFQKISSKNVEDKSLHEDSEDEEFDNSESDHSIDIKYIKNQFNSFSSKMHSKLKRKMIKLNQKSKLYFQKNERSEISKLPYSFDDEAVETESESSIEEPETRSYSAEINLAETRSYYDRKLEILLNLKRKIHKQMHTLERVKNNKGNTEGTSMGNTTKSNDIKTDVFDEIYDEDSGNEDFYTNPLQNNENQKHMNTSNLKDKKNDKEFIKTTELDITKGIVKSNVKNNIDKGVSRNDQDNSIQSENIQLTRVSESRNEPIKDKLTEIENIRNVEGISKTGFSFSRSDHQCQDKYVKDLLNKNMSLKKERNQTEISQNETIYPTKQSESGLTTNNSEIRPQSPLNPNQFIGNIESQSPPYSIKEISPKESLNIQERIKMHENLVNLQ